MPKGNSSKKINMQTYYDIDSALNYIYNMPDYFNNPKMTESQIRKEVVNHLYGIKKTDIDGRFEIPPNSKYADIIKKINELDASKSGNVKKYVEDKVHSLIEGLNGKQLRELGQELGYENITHWKSKEQRKSMVTWQVVSRFDEGYGNPILRTSLAEPTWKVERIVRDVKTRFTHIEIGRERLAKAISGLSSKEIKAYGKQLTWNKEQYEKYIREIKRLKVDGT